MENPDKRKGREWKNYMMVITSYLYEYEMNGNGNGRWNGRLNGRNEKMEKNGEMG